MLKYIHSLAYAGMSASYVGTCVGADKFWVSAILAGLYGALALHAYLHDRKNEHLTLNKKRRGRSPAFPKIRRV